MVILDASRTLRKLLPDSRLFFCSKSGSADGRGKCAAMIVADLLTGKRVSRAHIRGMDQILPPELNAFEFEALRQIAARPASYHVPSGVQSRLKDIGYVKEVLGGLVLTDDGLQRIAMDK